MQDPTTPSTTLDARSEAMAAFNRAWDLLDRRAATAAGPATDAAADRELDLDLLTEAVTSRWLWTRAGGPDEAIVGDWQVAHVLAVLGAPELSLGFAQRALAAAEAAGTAGWQLASVHEGMARAHAAAGDGDARAHHLATARAILDAAPDDEDGEEILRQLATVPPAA